MLGYDAKTWNGAHDGLVLIDVTDQGGGVDILLTCGPVLAGARCDDVDRVLDEHVQHRVDAWLVMQSRDPWQLHCCNHHRLQFVQATPSSHVTAVPAPG